MFDEFRPLFQRQTKAEDTTNSITYATTALYAAHGGLSSLTNGASNVVLSTLYYNKRLQPCRIAVNATGTAPDSCGDTNSSHVGNVMDLQYDFGLGTSDNGNVLGITNKITSARSQTFTYDALNRIATAAASTYSQSTAHCWGESFSIDAYGNLTGIGNLSSAYNGCANTENFSVTVSSTTNRFTTSGYCYDSAGNLLGQSNGTTYEYNAENQLKVTAGVTYTYDGDGKRVKADQTSGSTYDRLYWFGLGLDALAESDLSGNLTEEYVFFGGKRVARRNVSSGNVFYYFADHLGTSRAIVQAGQTSPCYDADFYPYGGERVVTNTCSQTYKFTGKERDAESGLDNFGARYDSSWMGRFMTPDLPFADQHIEDPQSWNLYAYVRNNPLAYVDPTGRACAIRLLNVFSSYCQRARAYLRIDAQVSSQTHFFAAAAATSQYISNVASPWVTDADVSEKTKDFLSHLGQDLKKMNDGLAQQIQRGSLGGPNLDASLVHMEQNAVETHLLMLKVTDPAAYATVISEANQGLNPSDDVRNTLLSTDKAYVGILDGVRKQLGGRPIDFANQKDREAIGNALIRHIRQNTLAAPEGCSVTRARGKDCQWM